MNLNQMFPSNYLKKEDFPVPKILTISGLSSAEIKGDGGKETKWTLAFSGLDKPLILNKGNAQAIADAYGNDSGYWIGKLVEVYNDPSVQFGGKRVGGIRVRIPTGSPSRLAWTVHEAIAKCAAVGVSKDQLRAAITAKGYSGWNPARDTELAQQLIAAKAQNSNPDADFPMDDGPGTDDGIPF